MSKQKSLIYFFLIFSVCLAAPFSNDIFISGLPQISQQFPGYNVSLIMSIGLLGLALAQPIYGPLLDRFGRRPILLFGLWIFTLASFQVMMADSFTLLLVGRFWQSVGACSAIISSLAIAKDCYENEKLVTVNSMIMAIIAISPTIAPLIGSELNTVWGWRASFAFLFILGCLFILLIQFGFRETLLHKNLEALKIKTITRNYYSLARNSNFLVYCIVSGFSYSILFSYFILSPLFIIQKMHFSIIHYGQIVASNALIIIATAIVVPRLMRKINLLSAMQLGLIFILMGGMLMWGINSYFVNNIYTFVLPMLLIIVGIGIIRPTAVAGAMQLVDKKIAGSAAAFFSFISFAGSAIATAVTSKIVVQVSSFGLFTIIMAVCALLSVGVNKKLSSHRELVVKSSY